MPAGLELCGLLRRQEPENGEAAPAFETGGFSLRNRVSGEIVDTEFDAVPQFRFVSFFQGVGEKQRFRRGQEVIVLFEQEAVRHRSGDGGPDEEQGEKQREQSVHEYSFLPHMVLLMFRLVRAPVPPPQCAAPVFAVADREADVADIAAEEKAGSFRAVRPLFGALAGSFLETVLDRRRPGVDDHAFIRLVDE